MGEGGLMAMAKPMVASFGKADSFADDNNTVSRPFCVIGAYPMNRFLMPLMALPLSLTACGGDTKTYTDEDGNKVEVTQKGDGEDVNVNVSSKDGDLTIKAGDSVDANAKLPYDLPMIGGATVSAQMSATDDKGEKGAMVTFVTDKSAEETYAFYKDAMADGGFKIENEMTSNDMRMLSGKRDDQTGIAITITPGEGDDADKTSVMIIAGME